MDHLVLLSDMAKQAFNEYIMHVYANFYTSEIEIKENG